MPDFFRYLPADPASADWGVQVRGGGRTRISAGQDYPPAGHPQDHRLDAEEGRILPAWQVIWISHGRGILWTARAGTQAVTAGSAFLLFPGERHRFSPDRATGWSEWWLELDGSLVSASGLEPARPIIPLRGDVVAADAMTRAVGLLERQPLGFRRELGGWVHLLLARLAILDRAAPEPHPGVHAATLAIQGEPQRGWTVAGLARLAGLSPSRFRKRFADHTGRSPRDYLIDLRLARMRAMLADPALGVADAARMAGFADPFYASRLFRSRFGSSPASWRRPR